MFYYVATNEEGRMILASTQEEVKKINPEFREINIPTTKPELQDFVQDLLDRIPVETPSTGETIVPTSEPIQIDQSAVVEYILNNASTNAIGCIFEALGVRFAELLKESKSS